MSLVKTSILNAVAVAIKLGCSLILNKFLAVYVGPAGYAVIGNFQNVFSILVSFSGGVLSAGVTKYTAQFFDDPRQQYRVWSTALRLSLAASLTIGVIVIISGQYISDWILGYQDTSSVFYWLALALPSIAVNSLLLSIVNGKKDVSVYIFSNIFGSILGLLLIVVFSRYFELYGALVAFSLSPAIAVLPTLYLIRQKPWFDVRLFLGKFDKKSAIDLSGFAVMGITSTLVLPITFILIRDLITTRFGLDGAGYWQASWKISEIYLMLISTTLSVYYLPRISEIRIAQELKEEIIKVYAFALPIVAIIALFIYLFRDFIIKTLFTADFYPMRDLFAWQLTGDLLKIASWVLAYILIARAKVRYFVITEIVFSVVFFVLSWVFVGYFGLTGVPMAYAANYFIYLITMFYLFRAGLLN